MIELSNLYYSLEGSDWNPLNTLTLLGWEAPTNLLWLWTSVQTHHTYIILVIFGMKISCFCHSIHLNFTVHFQWKKCSCSQEVRKQPFCILVRSLPALSKRLQAESLLTQQQLCCQLSINNELTMSWFCEMGKGLVIFVHNFKNRANATYLFQYYSAHLFKNHKPLAVISSRVHLIKCESQIETIRKSTSFVLLLESGNESIH